MKSRLGRIGRAFAKSIREANYEEHPECDEPCKYDAKEAKYVKCHPSKPTEELKATIKTRTSRTFNTARKCFATQILAELCIFKALKADTFEAECEELEALMDLIEDHVCKITSLEDECGIHWSREEINEGEDAFKLDESLLEKCVFASYQVFRFECKGKKENVSIGIG